MTDLKPFNKRSTEEVLALTALQEGMLYHYLKDPANDLYFEQLTLEISGIIDIKVFEKAWNLVAEINDRLRTVFRWEKLKHPLQVVLKKFHLNPVFHDFSNKETSDKNSLAEEIKIADREKKFDLRQVPFRVTLCKIEENRYQMIISNHHILYDGWSNGIILKEFFHIYNDLTNKRIPVKPAKTKFKEYIKWINTQDKKKQKTFWCSYLQGFEEPTELTIKNKTIDKNNIDSPVKYNLRLSQEIKTRVEEYIKLHKITLAALLYSSWGILLQKYNNSDDVLLGTTVSGRSARLKGIENIVGLFINTLPLRVRRNPGELIIDMLNQVNHALQVREEYEAASLADIKGYCGQGNEGELFDTLLVLENYPLERRLMLENSPLSVDSYAMAERTNYDLTVSIVVFDHIDIEFVYNRECISTGVIEGLAGHFYRIIEHLLMNQGQETDKIDILSWEEKQQLLVDFNSTDREYSGDERLHELFVKQVERIPDKIALVGKLQDTNSMQSSALRAAFNSYGEGHLTYRELDRQSDRLAYILTEKGVQADTVVGIMVERSIELVLGILAILKAGGAYLPIDPAYPGKRINYMLEDSGAKILVTTCTLAKEKEIEKLRSVKVKKNLEIIFIDSLDFDSSVFSSSHLLNLSTSHSFHSSHSSNLAYVIYTSGSTGKPKGVLVEHTSAVNVLQGLQAEYPVREGDAYLMKTSVVFDVSVTEIFGWYLGAGRLVILAGGGEKDPEQILFTIERAGITHINFVPSMFNAFIDTLNPRKSNRLSSLQYIFLAGETLLPGVVNKFKRLGTGIRLENIYGPTEGTVYSSQYSLDRWDGRGSIPIGTPMANTRLYIIDKTNHLQPVGAPGELCISGIGLARGYVNQPELTAGRFILATKAQRHKDVYFSRCPGSLVTKLYKTGDLARWLADGNIDFLGRIDQQVKIRGFRIETAEIESWLAAYDGIREAVVAARQDRDGDRYLCAYIIADESIEFPEIKNYLKEKLPGYMIPSYYVRLDRIPLTPTGKIDRKMLPEPEIKGNREYIAPGNEIEAALVGIWAEVLGIDDKRIGIADNFFELGGHSLKATRLVSRIHREFDIEVSLGQLFKRPTVRGLYRHIKEADQRIHRSIEAAEEKEYYPLSPVQKRLYFLQQTDLSNTSYNIPFVFLIETKPDNVRIQSVFRKLVERHESFRTSFKMIAGVPVQLISKKADIDVEYQEIRETVTDERCGWQEKIGNHDISAIIKCLVRPFDLSRTPLLRAGIVKFGAEQDFLFVDMHHIIADGTSMAILINEFSVLYSDTGAKLPELQLQYRDYAVWQHKGRDHQSGKQQEAYWLNQFKQDIPVLALPTDYARPVKQSFAGNTMDFTLDKHILQKLRALALEENSSLFMVLLALFNILLVKVSGQEDIVVGTGTAGRRHQDLGHIFGMFVNTLALRNTVRQDSSFNHFLGELTQRSVEAFENQEYPFENLVEKLAGQRDASRNPLFDVMFQLNHLDLNGINVPGLKLNAYPFETGVSKFDLTLWANEGPQGLLFAFEYCTDLFKKETIEIFIRYFKEIAYSVVTGPAGTKTIYEIRQITPESKQQILSLINQSIEQEVRDIFRRGHIFQSRLNNTLSRYDNKIAIECGSFALSYNEIDKRSNHVANLILLRGFARGTSVGVLMEDRSTIIIAAIGILKAGCAFVPLEPTYPQRRLEIMIDAADIKIILADRQNFNEFSCDDFLRCRSGEVESVLIDRWFSDLETAPLIQPPHIQYQPEDRVYIYFTSGSTGIPQAIAGRNISLMHFVHWEIDTFALDDTYRCSQLITPGFDAFLRDVFVPLCIGGVICIPAKKEVLSTPELLLNWLEYSRVHLVCSVPILFRILAANRLERDRLPELKTILLSGERINAHDLETWFQVFDERITVVNLWGTSETTMAKTFHLIRKSDLKRERIPVGKAMRGAAVLVLDEHMELSDPLVTGNLYIRTPFRSSGYCNDPQLNRERFIQNPFENNPDDLFHKSGDLGRILADGSIDLLGRNDRQVKIRGIRLELEEIESVLLKHPRVQEAVVLKDETSDYNEFLCAYVVEKLDIEKQVVEQTIEGTANEGLAEKLKGFLLERLPGYMIPNSIIQIDSLPRLPNGKIDFKALPAYTEKEQKQGYIPPQNHLQGKLIQLWTDILNVEAIGIRDNFFARGGNSLKVMALISRIHKDFDLRIPLGDIFNNPTVEKQALILEGQKKEMYAALEPLEKREYYPLSSTQKRLYVLQQMDGESVVYNMSQTYVFSTEPDREKIEQAFKQAIARHESFRTSCPVIGEEVVQRIADQVEFKLECYHCRLKDAHRQFIRPFVLSRAPLLRVGIVTLPVEERIAQSMGSSTTHLLMVDMHHIISDGVSSGILIEEFADYYANVSPPGLRLQYRDYVEWQNKSSIDKIRKQQEQYWLRQFEGEIPGLNLPIDFTRPLRQSFTGDTIHFEIGEEETQSLKSLALQEEVTLYMLLLSITSVLLALLGSQEDIIIGAPTAARRHADLQRIIGMFVNTLALRNRPCRDKTFRQFLQEVKKSTLEAFENQEFPFEELVEKLTLPRDTSRNPLFDTIFVLQNMEIPDIVMPALKLHPIDYNTGISKIDLTFNCVEKKKKLLIALEYCTGLFKEETILRISKCFRNIVPAIIKNPGKRISGISIIPEEEKQRILNEFNDTAYAYPRDKCILGLLAEQVKCRPDNIAVFGMVLGSGSAGGAGTIVASPGGGKHSGHITYHELDRQSGRLACLLREKGVTSDTTAAIMMERSLEMVIGLLGILKAGGAYLPIDPGWPENRLQYILKDSGAKVLVTCGSPVKDTAPDIERISLETLEVLTFPLSQLFNLSTSRPSDLAYVIYTSGTTGRPKGVLVNHPGLLNMVYAYQEVFAENSDSRISQVANPAFDATVSEIWPCLSIGATLYIVDNETRLSPGKMKQWLIEKEITNSFQPTVMAECLLEEEWPAEGVALKLLRTAGDRLTRYPAFPLPFVLYNLYGPTEDTVWTTWTEVKPEINPKGYPGIGKPVKNHRVYIFSENMQLQPFGIPGQLCIAGDGLARGYLNQPELTAEKFIVATKTQRHKVVYFSWCPGALVAELYKTGDLARWRPDGDIDFLGRIDNQVKIRGFRIEIAEIETLLLNREEIKEAVVLARKDKNREKYLCAYIVPNNITLKENPDVSEWRHYLSGALPDYMIPTYFIVLGKIPLTPHGKVDKRALPEPDTMVGKAYMPPRNILEEKLATIWAEILGIEGRIGIHDNFFELGGHSLKAAAFTFKIQTEMGLTIPLAALFTNPTIAGIAHFINKSSQQAYLSIKSLEKKEYYNASSAQKRLYFLQQLGANSTAYNMPQVLLMTGQPDRERLERASGKTIRRHESFKTSFEMLNNEVVQRIRDEVEFELDFFDLTPNETTCTFDEDFIYVVPRSFLRPFDIGRAPLLRMGLAKLEKEKYLLMTDMHHIISDGVSMTILIKEFSAMYSGTALPGLRLQYKDYAEWQYKHKHSKGIKKQETYWLRQFEGEIPILNLPLDFPPPPTQDFAGDYIDFKVDAKQTAALKSLAVTEKVTLFMLLLSIHNVWLSKLCGQEDIIVGIPTAGRSHADLRDIIGMFVNTLALRSQIFAGYTFKEYLEIIKTITLNAHENQEYDLEDLLVNLQLDRDASRNPLFDVTFLLQTLDFEELNIPGIKLKHLEYINNISKFVLSLQAVETGETLHLYMEYSSKRLKKETVHLFVRYFKQVLTDVLRDTGQIISQIELIPAEEKIKVLYAFNETGLQYPREQTLYDLFTQKVEAIPDHIALTEIITKSRGTGEFNLPANLISVTYRELNRQSAQVARLLKEKGVTGETIAGIMVERSVEMLIGIIGIIKAGGAYLPIDPDYPHDRKQYMLKDSGANVLITGSSLAKEAIPDIEGISIETFEVLNFSSSYLPDFSTSAPADLAYIIYTSGSTGRPKGVLVEHRSVVRLVTQANYIRYMDLNQYDRLLLTGNLVFDITTFEIWMPLLQGIRLYLADRDMIMDAGALLEIVTKNRISIMHLIPQLFNQHVFGCPEIFETLRCFLVGGDMVSPASVVHLRNKYSHLKILHMYGPTENTTFSTFFPVEKNENNYRERLPIGKPVSNSSVYILNSHNQFQPPGIYGELCTGGDGLVRGYLNNPELTAEKFARLILAGHRRKKVYKTGDLARWLPDGNIEFMGRIDHQVKIRGFRIEIEEIEKQLSAHPQIKESVVTTREDEQQEKYLCAYFVPVTNTNLPAAVLRDYLSQILPDYMIPSYFISLERIPITANGKVDRRALPAPEFKTGKDYKAPENHIEEKLTQIWSEVLDGREHRAIGTNDNFFELGGHSLKATIMAAKIHREFSVRIPLPAIFQNPTIARLAKTIKETAAEKYAAIQPSEEKEYYELSSGQKRLFIIQQMEPTITGYHISGAFELEGTADISRLEKTFGQVVQRHGSFRTSFVLMGTIPVQRVHEMVDFKIEHLQWEHTDSRAIIPGTETGFYDSFIRPFDLSRAPLLRVGLLKVHEQRHIIMVDMHHIISDGSSMAVLIENFMNLYKGEELPGLRIRYTDYSQWHNHEKNSGAINRQEAYWLNHLSGELPVLNLPLDYPRPPVQSFEGKTVKFEMDEEDTGALQSLALKEEVTLFMLLLAIINILLSKLSGQEEIIVGMPAAARRHADLQDIIGMFVNTLLLWNKPMGDKTFDRFLNEVKATTLNAYENQEYPFEDLVENVAVRRDASRNPLFDVIFTLQNMENREIEVPGLILKPHEYENKTSKFDLTIMAVETGNKLVFNIEYCTKLFKQETILGFVTYLKNLVGSIRKDSRCKISGLCFIPAEEKQRLLYEFNDTSPEISTGKTLHDLFREQAEQVPDHIALIGKLQNRNDKQSGILQAVLNSPDEGSLTYRELNQQSDGLALLLREKRIGPDTIVAIMLERSVEMIVGIMGILKAGGAYLPIDADHPEDRIGYMLKDSGTNLLITTGTIIKEVTKDLEIIYMDSIDMGFPDFSTSQRLNVSTSCPSSLAYIIYTSGTTGQPKGNLTTHANVIRVVKNTNYIDLTGTDRILQLSNYAFDGSVFDIYGALVNGSVLVMVGRETVIAVDQLALFIKRQHITVFFVTTALFNTLIDMQIDCFAHIRKVLFGGERVSLEHSRQALEYMGKGKVLHVYGPTETTVYATYYFMDHILADSVTIPIGKPITHTTAYVLDKYHELVPIGITGELYIGDQGLARGYLNQPQLTAEKFETRNNQTFLRGSRGQFLQKAPPGRRRQILYKTGDLVKRQRDGNIEFIGRIDSQIKIRGFRVELGEIEARLLNHGQIKEAVVITRNLGEGNQQLVAYIVNRSADTGSISSLELREYLSGFLPDFMIPSYIIELEKLPLTANGKVDKKMLPWPDVFKPSARENFAAPATDMEKRIADIWKEVLKLEEVGIDDNFFDIGGNSLNILQVNQKLNTFFAVPLPVIIMFRYTTIRSLSGYLSQQEADDTLDRKKRSEELQQGKSDRLKRYRKREQRNRRVEVNEK